jgi:sec-independent protein translocase protein TatA
MLLFIPLFIGSTELILIGCVALLLFGGKKLPEMMHGLGRGVQEFKKGLKDEPMVNNQRSNISSNSEVEKQEHEK